MHRLNSTHLYHLIESMKIQVLFSMLESPIGNSEELFIPPSLVTVKQKIIQEG